MNIKWDYKKIGDVCIVERGGSPRPIENFITDSSDGINWIKIGDTDDSMYITKTAQKIRPEGMKKSRYVQPGDFLLSNSMSFGRPYILKIDGCIHDGWLVLRDKDALFDKRFLYYYLSAESTYMKFKGMAVGGVVNNLNSEMVRKVTVPVPPKTEQSVIADRLDIVNTIISFRQQQLAKLDELVKARFVEMFGDMLLNPMAWPEVALETLADIVSGITKGRKVKEQTLVEVPYMAVSNVKDGYIDWTTVKTILATEREIEQYCLFPDDVLMTEGGDPDKVGRGAIIKEPLENCIHQNHIFRVRLDKGKILPTFFTEYLQHQKAKRYFLGCAKQTTGIASINMKQLKALAVLLPPLDLQQKFDEFVRQVELVSCSIQNYLEQMETLKKALMQQYFG